MSHELHSVSGKTSMAYVGAVPWHGLGQSLTSGASIETWIREAGMEYELLSSKVAYKTADNKTAIFPNRQVLFRSDDGAPLGLVGDTYKVVQPREVIEFFRSLADDYGFELETAGVLFGGRKYWALAKTPESFKVGKSDEVKGHLMLATACDGSMSTIAKYVATRVVCQNTIQIALGEGGPVVKTRHNAEFKAAEVKSELGLLHESFSAFALAAKTLGKVKLGSAQAVQFLINLMGDPTVPVEEQTKNVDNMKAIAEKFATQNYIGHDLSGATAWGLVNCVTEFVDHTRGRGQDRRLEHAWFSAGMDLKMNAFQKAQEMFVS